MKLFVISLLAVACAADKLAINQAAPESAQSAGADEFLVSPRSYDPPKYSNYKPNYVIPNPPQNNYVQPQNNYVPPQNNYVPPQNNYVPPQNNYVPPQNNYVQPQNDNYYPQQNTYVPPQNNYVPPQNTYVPPQNNYVPPQNSYVPPQNNYVPPPTAQPPQNNYIPSKNDYATSAPQPDYSQQYVTPAVPILQSSSVQNIDGSFKYEYLTGDNTYVEQEGHIENAGTDNEIQVVTGSYSYVGGDGKTYKVTYIADGNGFRATGDHLPKPPPIPKAIQAALDKNAAEEAAAAAAAQQGGYIPPTTYPNQGYNPGQYVPPNNNYNPNYAYPAQNNQNYQQHGYNTNKQY